MKIREIRKLKRVVESMSTSSKEMQIAKAIRHIFEVDVDEGFKLLKEAKSK